MVIELKKVIIETNNDAEFKRLVEYLNNKGINCPLKEVPTEYYKIKNIQASIIINSYGDFDGWCNRQYFRAGNYINYTFISFKQLVPRKRIVL